MKQEVSILQSLRAHPCGWFIDVSRDHSGKGNLFGRVKLFVFLLSFTYCRMFSIGKLSMAPAFFNQRNVFHFIYPTHEGIVMACLQYHKFIKGGRNSCPYKRYPLFWAAVFFLISLSPAKACKEKIDHDIAKSPAKIGYWHKHRLACGIKFRPPALLIKIRMLAHHRRYSDQQAKPC